MWHIGKVAGREEGWNYKKSSIMINIPPLATVILRPVRGENGERSK